LDIRGSYTSADAGKARHAHASDRPQTSAYGAFHSRQSGTARPVAKSGKSIAVRLSSAIDADVCVVGADIASLTVAYRLACEGRSVIVLEDKEIGSGENGTNHCIQDIVTDEGIECDLERVEGYLFLGPHDAESLLDEELDALRQGGLPAPWT
jgi:hypothetical protein